MVLLPHEKLLSNYLPLFDNSGLHDWLPKDCTVSFSTVTSILGRWNGERIVVLEAHPVWALSRSRAFPPPITLTTGSQSVVRATEARELQNHSLREWGLEIWFLICFPIAFCVSKSLRTGLKVTLLQSRVLTQLY